MITSSKKSRDFDYCFCVFWKMLCSTTLMQGFIGRDYLVQDLWRGSFLLPLPLLFNVESDAKSEIILNQELSEALHKAIMKNLKNKKHNSSLIDKIWGVDLEIMQLISKFNKGFRFLLCIIDIYSKNVWFVSLKCKKGIIVTDAFPKTSDKSGRKPNIVFVDKVSEFYNRSMNSRSQFDDIEMYSTYNLRKCCFWNIH